MFITIGIIVVSIFIISAIAGTVASNNPNSGSGTSNDGCEQCRMDRAWYRNQRLGRRIALAGWFAALQLRCALRKC